jgi:hypothetical protein
MVLLVVGLKSVAALRVVPSAPSRFQQQSCSNSGAPGRIRDASAESIN